MKKCNCRSVGECPHWGKPDKEFEKERKKLNKLVDRFAAEMKRKLLVKQVNGYIGWDKKECRDGIEKILIEHANKLVSGDVTQAADVANLSAMLWNMREAQDDTKR